jgi:hypothetical protein
MDIAEYRIGLKKFEEVIKDLDQVECPLLHDFAPGIYLRRILMPKGAYIIGKTHKTKHFNIILSGEANVMIDGVIQNIKAPCVFTSNPGIKKALFIIKEMIWATVHPTDETDIEKLEELFVFNEKEEKEMIEELKLKLEQQ